MQGYDAAVHIVRRGLSSTSIFTWLLLSVSNVSQSTMKMIRDVDDVGGQLFSCLSRYMSNAVVGSGVRFEAVVSGNTTADVLSLMQTYGSRMLQLCLSEGLLARSDKSWPEYVNARIAENLRRLRDLVIKAESTNFNRSVSISFVTLGFFGMFMVVCIV